MNRVPLTTFPLQELVALARQRTPFYRDLYANVPENPALTDLPVLDLAEFWDAHARDPRNILTGPPFGGTVLSTGGSTGAPKFSYFTDSEWDSGVALVSRATEGTGLRDGDRAANLFAAGYMFASFVLVAEALKDTPAKTLQLPIGYFVPPPDSLRLMMAFNVNVWVGVPTHLMTLVDYMDKQNINTLKIERILFAGEPMTNDQRAFLEKRFPGVTIRSMGYASVDGGVIGNGAADCGPGEHRVFDGAALVEILDEETGEVIEEPRQPGKIIFTNLTRRLMPTLRYSTGDRGYWLEPAGTPERKFMLLGRAEESARMAIFNLPVSEMAKLLEPFRQPYEIQQFQMLVTQEDRRDRLTLRLVSKAPQVMLSAGEEEITKSFLKYKPVYGELVESGVVWPMKVEWITQEQLEVHPRTGKTRMVIDRRVE